MKADFLMKIQSGVVDGYYSYFDMVAKRGQPDMTCLVADNMQSLLNIEKSIRPEVKELEPL